MQKNIDILSKEAMINDLLLIKSCLRLLNGNISCLKSQGKDFSSSEKEEINMQISKIARNLDRVKRNIQYET